MASASIAELPEMAATMNLVAAIALFPPTAAKTGMLLEREATLGESLVRQLVPAPLALPWVADSAALGLPPHV
jgi:hypothetical protein